MEKVKDHIFGFNINFNGDNGDIEWTDPNGSNHRGKIAEVQRTYFQDGANRVCTQLRFIVDKIYC